MYNPQAENTDNPFSQQKLIIFVYILLISRVEPAFFLAFSCTYLCYFYSIFLLDPTGLITCLMIVVHLHNWNDTGTLHKEKKIFFDQ